MTTKDQRIYTRRGDSGETSLAGGVRVFKDHHRIDFCGEMDEFSSALGVARAEGLDARHDEIIERIQRELQIFCTEIVTTPLQNVTRRLTHEQVSALEQEIDRLEELLQPLRHFVIPGGKKSAAYLHLARTICRRAERSLVSLARTEPDISAVLLQYLNRLSDLLFVMARIENEVLSR